MGTPSINLACFITLVAVVRLPPFYKEGDPQPKTADELNFEARLMFICLIIMHCITSMYRYFQLNGSLKEYLASLNGLFMTAWALIVAAIAFNWSYPRAPNNAYLISIGLFPT